MDSFDIMDTLSTFRIIADTREQRTPRAEERFRAFGVPVIRATLNYCDYCGQITLPNGDLHRIDSAINPACCIERKMSLDELATCFTRGRDRFRREFERATAARAKTYLLIENGSWEGIYNHRYRSKYHPSAFIASLTAWAIRYDISVVFCKADTSGKLIKEILYRDMKERLARGEYG